MTLKTQPAVKGAALLLGLLTACGGAVPKDPYPTPQVPDGRVGYKTRLYSEHIGWTGGAAVARDAAETVWLIHTGTEAVVCDTAPDQRCRPVQWTDQSRHASNAGILAPGTLGRLSGRRGVENLAFTSRAPGSSAALRDRGVWVVSVWLYRCEATESAARCRPALLNGEPIELRRVLAHHSIDRGADDPADAVWVLIDDGALVRCVAGVADETRCVEGRYPVETRGGS